MCDIKTVIEKIRRNGSGLKKDYIKRNFEGCIAAGKKNIGIVKTQKRQNNHNKERDYSVRYQSHIDHQWSGWDNIMK